MRLSSEVALIAIAIGLVQAAPVLSSQSNNQLPAAGSFLVDSSNFNHLNPVQVTRQNSLSIKKRNTLSKHIIQRSIPSIVREEKRDYATTLRYLQAAMESYRKDTAAASYGFNPEASFLQIDPVSTAAPESTPAIMPPIAPLWSMYSPPIPFEEAVTAPQDPTAEQLSITEPTATTIETFPLATPELGNEMTEVVPKTPVGADIEDDDKFDPEEDPDDVDDPPVVNGVAVEREE